VTATARVFDMPKAPDSAAFGALYAEHFRAVWRMLARLGVNPASVDDATQEVFVTAWKRFGDFEGRSTARTWLLGIALRVASDTRRKQRPTEQVSEQLEQHGPSPEKAIASKQLSRKVEALLNSLEAERREVMLLVDLEGYSVPEVGEATGTNVNTLYTRLRAARQQFEELVKRDAQELR
jgi:RNA polymerase sigma-70 factor (ECF subfamily)